MVGLKELINSAILDMQTVGIADAVTDAWLLLEYGLGITRQRYYMDMNMSISEEDADIFRALIQKRLKRTPLQYITGHQEFMGMDFVVNEDVLIPRQDTELLVEKTIQAINKLRDKQGQSAKKIRVLDMCTGSGCIAVAIAKLCQDVEVVGADIACESIKVAEQNAKLNGVEVEFVQSDLFQNIKGRFNIIVSNPPYIPTDVITTLETEVRDHEPMRALDGSKDGLKFYELITYAIPQFLEDDGIVLYEIGHDQGESVSSLLRKFYSCVKVYKDLAGLDRVVIAGKDE